MYNKLILKVNCPLWKKPNRFLQTKFVICLMIVNQQVTKDKWTSQQYSNPPDNSIAIY